MTLRSIVRNVLPLPARKRLRAWATTLATTPTVPETIEERAAAITHSAAFKRLSYHPKAGQIEDGRQYLYDGSVTVQPWAPPEIERLVMLTKGAPEPQETLALVESFPHMPTDPIMVELGAGWSYFSIITGSKLPEARLFLVEANPRLMEIARQNMTLNDLTTQATFIERAVADIDGLKLNFSERGYGSAIHDEGEYQTTSITVEQLMADYDLPHIDILQMDVQHTELKTILGMQNALRAGTIRYVIISTHSGALHTACAQLMQAFDYVQITAHNFKDYGGDGLLVYAQPEFAAKMSGAL